ncbi:MAG: hypothetical protein RLO46_22310 [Pseudomonadales bacterium]
MTVPSTSADELPDVQVLMAAVIRLMSRCLANPGAAESRTLLHLLAQLRQHPDLRRDPAVRAALAESHFAWIERRVPPQGAVVAELPPCARDSRKLH